MGWNDGGGSILDRTERICLESNFLASLFQGRLIFWWVLSYLLELTLIRMPLIDVGDVAGSNLFNIVDRD